MKSTDWEDFDDAITRLAEKTLTNGHKLKLSLHFRGNPSMELFNQAFPRFAESGDLEVVKTSHILIGSALYPLSF